MPGKKLLTASCIVIGIGLILYLPSLIHQGETERSVGRYDCLIRDTACNATLDGVGQVSLQISPSTLPVMQPLALAVQLPEKEVKEVDAVSVQFVGRDMDMGLQPVRLSRESGTDTLWRGNGVISLCTVNADMAWLARVTFVVSGKPYRVEFLLGQAGH